MTNQKLIPDLAAVRAHARSAVFALLDHIAAVEAELAQQKALVERLGGVLEKAPHGGLCTMTFQVNDDTLRIEISPCTCWRAEAIALIAPEQAAGEGE